jgi:hypothetical protein
MRQMYETCLKMRPVNVFDISLDIEFDRKASRKSNLLIFLYLVLFFIEMKCKDEIDLAVKGSVSWICGLFVYVCTTVGINELISKTFLILMI